MDRAPRHMAVKSSPRCTEIQYRVTARGLVLHSPSQAFPFVKQFTLPRVEAYQEILTGYLPSLTSYLWYTPESHRASDSGLGLSDAWAGTHIVPKAYIMVIRSSGLTTTTSFISTYKDMAQYSDKDKNLDNIIQQDVLESGDKNLVHNRVVDLAARAHLEQVDYTEEESKAVLRKIDWHLMPMLIWICEF